MAVKVSLTSKEYVEYLHKALVEMCQAGQGTFTLKELARHSNLTVTPNMRRRINDLVYSGDIIIPAYINIKRGVERVYEFNVGESE